VQVRLKDQRVTPGARCDSDALTKGLAGAGSWKDAVGRPLAEPAERAHVQWSNDSAAAAGPMLSAVPVVAEQWRRNGGGVEAGHHSSPPSRPADQGRDLMSPMSALILDNAWQRQLQVGEHPRRRDERREW